jgi:hypothetical protein
MREQSDILKSIRIASPCPVDWNSMAGDERTRFCGQCRKNVHNISQMTEADAVALLTQAAGSVCVQIYRRADGTVLTADCPVGLREKARRLRRRTIAAVSLLIAAAAGFIGLKRKTCSALGLHAVTPLTGGVPAPGEGLRGDVAVAPPTRGEPVDADPPRHIKGRVSIQPAGERR